MQTTYFFAHIGLVLRVEYASNYALITPHITPPLSKLENTSVCVDVVYFFSAENASDLDIELYGKRNFCLENASNV